MIIPECTLESYIFITNLLIIFVLSSSLGNSYEFNPNSVRCHDCSRTCSREIPAVCNPCIIVFRPP